MTDETRETLSKLYEKFEYDHPYGTALRDVLTPRTCGTCKHATDEHTRGTVEHGYVAVVCVKRGGYWRADDGCIRGWQAREGEGGTR